MSIKKLLGKSIHRVNALSALKQDTIEQSSPEEGIPVLPRQNRIIVNQEELTSHKLELRKEKSAKAKMKVSARWKSIEIEKAKGPRASAVYMYKDGDLVTCKRDIWRGPKKGAVGIVVDKDDTGKNYLLKFESNRYLWVINEEGMTVQWDAKWVEWANDEDEDRPQHIEDTDENIDVQNFEILQGETIESLGEPKEEALPLEEGNMVVWQDETVIVYEDDIHAFIPSSIGELKDGDTFIVMNILRIQNTPDIKKQYRVLALMGESMCQFVISEDQKFEVL